MKRLFIYLFIVLFPACSSQLFASYEYQEDMDSLLHKVEGHRQGVVVLNEEGVKMKIYMSTSFEAPNGKSYYRWWDGGRNIVMFEHDPARLSDNGFVPLPYGYRFDDEKMYLYNFLTDKEAVAYDFTLQPGEQFTTPDGISWEVVGRRTEIFESMFEYQTDYKNEHVVLSLQSLDGTKTDEWVQHIGSLQYPIQIWDRTDIKLARTAFFNFGESGDKLVYFDFAEDPLYGQIIYVDPDPYAMSDIYRDYTVTAGNKSLNIAINYYIWFTREYCYTYRDGSTFDIHSIELGPYRDGGEDETPSFGLTFPGAPSYDHYNIVYNGEVLTSSSIGALQEPGKNCPAFDLSGRRLSARPTKGLYIEDGKVRVGMKK